MIWVDVALRTAALASAIIATLRAGSRATYLLEHDTIGIMEGPTIQKNSNNETSSPLFELSEAFRHCVRLSSSPGYYENVQRKQPVLTVVEPYPLSPKPYLPRKTQTKSDVTTVENIVEATETAVVKQIEESKAITSFWGRQYSTFARTLSAVPSSISYTGKYLGMTPQLVSYWTARFWNLKREEPEEIELEEDDWDYNWSTEGQLRFNATTASKDGTPTATPRVAELSVFAPSTFEHLRGPVFGISEAEYRQSMFGAGPFVSFQSNSKGAARVGGVFFFTRDGAYMIKTIKKEEAKTFLKMLPKYHKHMKRHGRNSLLTRFCGVYGVRIYDEDSLDHGQLHTFVVMNAVFPAEASKFISERFDLKGSTVGREVSEEELKKKGSDAVMKDLDLAREVQLVKSMEKGSVSMQNYGINIGPHAKSALLSQLREDVKLLVECQVMDYSLLVGVVDMETFLRFDRSARQAIQAIKKVGKKFSTSKKVEERALWAMGAPLRLLSAPPVFLAKQSWTIAQRTLGSIVTWPLPYYGSGECGVDGGLLSVFHGTRNGGRALYYMGLIDFLQPWTTRKVVERQFKGLIGYDVNAISCVTPEEYADRFLDFLDAHLS